MVTGKQRMQNHTMQYDRAKGPMERAAERTGLQQGGAEGGKEDEGATVPCEEEGRRREMERQKHGKGKQ